MVFLVYVYGIPWLWFSDLSQFSDLLPWLQFSDLSQFINYIINYDTQFKEDLSCLLYGNSDYSTFINIITGMSYVNNRVEIGAKDVGSLPLKLGSPEKKGVKIIS